MNMECEEYQNGLLGVPISFLDKYDPREWKIVDLIRPKLNDKELYCKLVIRRREKYVGLFKENGEQLLIDNITWKTMWWKINKNFFEQYLKVYGVGKYFVFSPELDVCELEIYEAVEDENKEIIIKDPVTISIDDIL